MRALLVAIVWLAACTAVQAAELPPVVVEYSADSVMEAEGMTMRTKVYHASYMERREVNLGAQRQIMILRMDKGVSWMLMPDSRQYMQMPIGTGLETSGDLAGYDIQRSAVGEEKVSGLKSTKYKVVMSSPDGFRLDGFMWISDHGIVLKLDAQSDSSEHGGHMRMELSNVRIGKQDLKLFEIPEGYTKFDMGSFSGMSGR